MKKVLTVMALAVVCAAVQSCADRQVREAGAMAESFVKAYFAAEYDKAAAMCGDELRAKVEESARQIETLPDSLKSAFLELAAELDPQAGVVYELSRDSVMVDFDILVPDEMEPMRNSVLVVRNSETGVWSVEEIR